MNNYITIDATNARNDFFNILEKVYLDNNSYLIKKSGIPVAEIRKPRSVTNEDILHFAGIWKGKDGDTIEKYAKKLRKKLKIVNI